MRHVPGKTLAKKSGEKEELLSALSEIDTERLQILYEGYRDTKIQPSIMRRATVLYRLCCDKTIYIDGNPIVGTLTKYKYGAHPSPEEGCAWMKRTEEFALSRGKVRIKPEVSITY